MKYAKNSYVKLFDHHKLGSLLSETNSGDRESGLLKYCILPFIYKNHASLIVYGHAKNKVYHVDSLFQDKQHIKILKPKL